MPYAKLCFPHGQRRICVRIQKRVLGLNIPQSPEIVFEIDGKEAAWSAGVEAVAAMQSLTAQAGSEVGRILASATEQAAREISQQLPEGVQFSLGE